MIPKEIPITPAEAAAIRKLTAKIRATCPDDLRIFNFCRRIDMLLTRADRRRYKIKHSTNKLLLQPEIIYEIYN